MKKTCVNCIHKEVCSIYANAKKFIKESVSSHFKPSSMADVCNNWLNFSIKK